MPAWPTLAAGLTSVAARHLHFVVLVVVGKSGRLWWTAQHSDSPTVVAMAPAFQKRPTNLASVPPALRPSPPQYPVGSSFSFWGFCKWGVLGCVFHQSQSHPLPKARAHSFTALYLRSIRSFWSYLAYLHYFRQLRALREQFFFLIKCRHVKDICCYTAIPLVQSSTLTPVCPRPSRYVPWYLVQQPRSTSLPINNQDEQGLAHLNLSISASSSHSFSH